MNNFKYGDTVRIKEGFYEGLQGEIKEVYLKGFRRQTSRGCVETKKAGEINLPLRLIEKNDQRTAQ